MNFVMLLKGIYVIIFLERIYVGYYVFFGKTKSLDGVNVHLIIKSYAWGINIKERFEFFSFYNSPN